MSRINVYTLTDDQRKLLVDINTTLEHPWDLNINIILKHGRYNDAQKNRILIPLRKIYIEHLKNKQ